MSLRESEEALALDWCVTALAIISPGLNNVMFATEGAFNCRPNSCRLQF